MTPDKKQIRKYKLLKFIFGVTIASDIMGFYFTDKELFNSLTTENE